MSFFKLYTSINDSIIDTNYKNTELWYFSSVVLNPNETYLQLSNYDGGLSFGGNYQAHVIDVCGNVLKDITSHVYIAEFTDANGNTQNAIEIVNINQDFYGQVVLIRFYHQLSDSYYYTRPLKITDDTNNTYRFDYTNSSNLHDLSYENASYTQSIRLDCKFTNLENNSEAGDYYQISSSRNISTRLLEKIAHAYLLEDIDDYTFRLVQELFKHDTIYIDNKRITNNPILEATERKGNTNMFDATFTAYIDTEDTFTFTYQLFDGLNAVLYDPSGSYLTGTSFLFYNIFFDKEPTLKTGTIKVYNSSNVLLHTFTESDMIVSSNTVVASAIGTPVQSLADGSYYVKVSSGLASFLNVDYEGVSDNTTWTFTLQAGDYSNTDYSNDYLIN